MQHGPESDATAPHEGDARYRSLVENAFDVIVECAANGRVLYVSPNIADVLGYAASDIVGGFINELVHPDDVRKGIETFSAAVMRGDRIHGTLRYRHQAGGWRWIEGRGKSYLNASGKLRVVIIGRDISDRVASDVELRRLLRRIQLQVEQTPAAIIVWGRDHRVTEWNPGAAELFGYAKADIIGRDLAVLAPDGSARVESYINEAYGGPGGGSGSVRYSAENVTKTGRRITCEWVVAPLFDEQRAVTGYLGIAQDVSTRVAIKRLEDLAYRDPVTGIPNRRAFDERLTSLLESRRRRSDEIAVLYVDLDDFKAVNDTHGHAIGDRVLAALGLRLQVCVRDSDLVARLGGDEFGVLLTHITSERHAEDAAVRIADSLSQPLHAGELTFQIHASVGIAKFPADGSDAAGLLRAADQAMYRAKQKGKSSCSGEGRSS